MQHVQFNNIHPSFVGHPSAVMQLSCLQKPDNKFWILDPHQVTSGTREWRSGTKKDLWCAKQGTQVPAPARSKIIQKTFTFWLSRILQSACGRVCVHLRYAKKLYILQSLFTLILHLALLWRQLPFMKYSRCGAPSRSVTVLSCSFFGAPEPVRGCTAFLKLKAMQNSYYCCINAARTAHTGRSISLWARYRSLLQIAHLWWQGLCSFCTLLDLSIDSCSFWLTKKTCSSLYSWLRSIRM
jgi:hypothetical protein